MEERFEDAKGRAKEAAGDLVDDTDLRREGQLDRGQAAAKSKVDDAVDKAHDVLDEARDKGKSFIERARERARQRRR